MENLRNWMQKTNERTSVSSLCSWNSKWAKIWFINSNIRAVRPKQQAEQLLCTVRYHGDGGDRVRSQSADIQGYKYCTKCAEPDPLSIKNSPISYFYDKWKYPNEGGKELMMQISLQLFSYCLIMWKNENKRCDLFSSNFADCNTG